VLIKSILKRLRGVVEKQGTVDAAEKAQQQEASAAEEALDRLEADSDHYLPSTVVTAVGSGAAVAAAVSAPLQVVPQLAGAAVGAVPAWTPLGCRNKRLDPEGGESDVDCGGLVCNKCANGKKCDENAGCSSLKCDTGRCVYTPWQKVTEKVSGLQVQQLTQRGLYNY
jgi:hypothetical protein